MSVGKVKASDVLQIVIVISTFLAPFSVARWYNAIEDYGTAWFFVFGVLYMSEWVDYSWWFIPLWLEYTSILEVIAPFALIWVLIGLTFAKVVGKAPDLSHSSEGLALLALAAILMEMGGIVIANMIRPGGSYSMWNWFDLLIPLPINLIVSLIGLIMLRNRRNDSVMP